MKFKNYDFWSKQKWFEISCKIFLVSSSSWTIISWIEKYFKLLFLCLLQCISGAFSKEMIQFYLFLRIENIQNTPLWKKMIPPLNSEFLIKLFFVFKLGVMSKMFRIRLLTDSKGEQHFRMRGSRFHPVFLHVLCEFTLWGHYYCFV